ncbi:NucA/NucB deoxyribonuclease domain-containing protein [Rhodococcus sp. 14-2470-1b]|uniref:NucA/NucB deoxyribonuclease domain-containing protein n=1 Tax=Rhodococcus sp. 14-2470-1b TaxID=2023149 RepID=UPI001140240C|nr:NucA/NucB deoxyribonuclease domain-containing protein [Rhodococcus sp. 14-2470-1b]
MFSRNRCKRIVAIAVMVMAASAAATPIASGTPSAPTPPVTSSPSPPAADQVPSPSPLDGDVYSRIVPLAPDAAARSAATDPTAPTYLCNLPSRTSACKTNGFVIEQVTRGTENVIGRYFVDLMLTSRNDVRSLSSTLTVDATIKKVLVGSTDGGSLALDLIATQYEQGANGTDKTIGQYSIPVNDGSVLPQKSFPDFTKRITAANSYTSSTYKIKVTYTPPPSQEPLRPTDTLPMAGVAIRCDNAEMIQSGTAGCVNPEFRPTVTFSRSTTPDIAKNITNGQASLDRIGTPFGGPLHRVTTAERDANRAIACSTARKAALAPPRADMVSPSCDEYPFASSLEGGSNTVIAWVPQTENSSQGATLKNFFDRNRILPFAAVRDAYYVSVGS